MQQHGARTCHGPQTSSRGASRHQPEGQAVYRTRGIRNTQTAPAVAPWLERGPTGPRVSGSTRIQGM